MRQFASVQREGGAGPCAHLVSVVMFSVPRCNCMMRWSKSAVTTRKSTCSSRCSWSRARSRTRLVLKHCPPLSIEQHAAGIRGALLVVEHA